MFLMSEVPLYTQNQARGRWWPSRACAIFTLGRGAPIGCTLCIVKSFRSRRSFILPFEPNSKPEAGRANAVNVGRVWS